MDFWEAMGKRRSVRRFERGQDVPKEMVERLLEAAISAPSAGNRQPWHFLVVRDGETKMRLARAAWGQHFVAEAPVVIVVCADPGRSGWRYGQRGADLYCLQDTAAATQNILLAAVALGLGACWVGAFDEGAVTRVLNLPSHLSPVAIVPIGYPAESPYRPTRRALKEVTTFVE